METVLCRLESSTPLLQVTGFGTGMDQPSGVPCDPGYPGAAAFAERFPGWNPSLTIFNCDPLLLAFPVPPVSVAQVSAALVFTAPPGMAGGDQAAQVSDVQDSTVPVPGELALPVMDFSVPTLAGLVPAGLVPAGLVPAGLVPAGPAAFQR